MAKRLAALIFIFACTTVAWIILGSTIMARTYDVRSGDLFSRVETNWGTSQQQFPPRATWTKTKKRTEDDQDKQGRHFKRVVEYTDDGKLAIAGSAINVALDLEHRQKGLLWYRTYVVDFAADYRFPNDTNEEQQIVFEFFFPAKATIYDKLVFEVNGQKVPTSTQERNVIGGSVTGKATLAAGETAVLHVSYQSHGLDTWHYNFAPGEGVAQVHDFKLHMTTNFKDIDFAENTLSPTTKRETPNGWALDWDYTNLVTGYSLGMVMPEHLQPGPLAGQISFFAPVSLFFFFFLMFIITTLRGIDLHPMNYFFLAAAFFAFHLLLAYLVDHISIHLAFAASSLVSIFLVISYLRLVVGIRFAAVEAGLAQFVYLVLFSYAFFFKGFTGLGVTIGSIVTLFVVMQLTGRVDWTAKFAKAAKPEPARA
ncbi:MAG: inner membrane CreD family protein [Candidatus Koribacter versatilis]|uniref:Inner membrane CreD family protein n=1 Tax=Candidatus Korobacter versatilis TaxID=658062 RepID=A0A932ERK4_9BACT|nr:inner membrane CreD family protein [Candidatus Koribacter versatilis]